MWADGPRASYHHSYMIIPPRIKVLFFLTCILLICAGIVWWIYFGDRGTVLIEGDHPDKLNGMLIGNQRCEKTPCQLIVRPGEYTVKFEKNGFYPLTKTVRVYLFETSRVELRFTLQPALEKLGSLTPFSVPVDQVAPGYKDNQQQIALSERTSPLPLSLPETMPPIREISFSPSGKQALLITASGSYLWQNNRIETAVLPAPSDGYTWWQETALFFWQKREAGQIWQLSVWDPVQKTTSAESTLYRLTRGTILPGAKYVAVLEEGLIYLVDRQSKERVELPSDESFLQGKWNASGTLLLLTSRTGNNSVLDTSRQKIEPLPAPLEKIALGQLEFLKDTVLLAVSSTDGTIRLTSYALDSGTTSSVSVGKVDRPEIIKTSARDGRIFIQINNDVYQLQGEIL